MPAFETAALRRARIAREAEAATEARAARVLDDIGWSAQAGDIEGAVRSKCGRLTEAGKEAVVEAARRLQQDPRARHEAMARKSAATKATRAGIRELLKERQDLTASQMYHVLRERGVNLCAQSSFASHVTEVRKELGVTWGKPSLTPAENVNTAATEPLPEVVEKPDQDLHTPDFVDRVLDEIERVEGRLKKLRVALEVAQEMEGAACEP